MGTTATGKTDAAAALFDSFEAEIISVDSSLVYRGMDIGSAKPDADFLKKYPHHLVDIRDPEETFSVADFYHHATALIDSISKRGAIPILVGGTHFYFAALCKGLSNLPPANTKIREELSARALIEGWPSLHRELAKVDRVSASRINENDAQRIQRALEVVMLSGKTVAQHNQYRKPPIDNPMINIALAYSDRGFLHQQIEKRFDLMLTNGFQQEVEGLLAAGIPADCTAMRMIGYRQMLEFLDGVTTYEDMKHKGIAATRQLAKRQLTWLRNQPNTVWWVDSGLKQKNFAGLIAFVKNYLP